MDGVLTSVRNNDVNGLTTQLSCRVDSEVKDKALVCAVVQGHLEVTKCLLAVGSNPNSTDGSGNSVLYLSVKGRHGDIVEELCSSGANVNERNLGGITALHWAVKNCQGDCLQALIDHGADLDLKDTSGSSPLILAVRHKRYVAIRALLSAGCDVNVKDKEGRTALHYGSHTAVAVDLLINAGADVNVKDNNNSTPLLLAASEGLDGAVASLCDVPGCDVNIQNSSVRKSPLHILAAKGHIRGVVSLVNRGGDVNLLDSQHKTPLSYAVVKGKCDVIVAILKSSLLKPTCQACGETDPRDVCPVLLAADRRRLDILKLFILAGFCPPCIRVVLAGDDVRNLFIEHNLSHWLTRGQAAHSLTHLCRQTLRHKLGVSLVSYLSHLSLPSRLVNYLRFSELDDLLKT